MIKPFVLSLAVGLALAPGLAEACSMVGPRNPSLAEQRRSAETTVDWAVAIIDGEVVRPFDETTPALVRAVRVFKGPQQEFFEVGEQTSCDLVLDAAGTRIRLFLIGGPDVWYAPATLSNPIYEDELLGSDRTEDWPFQWGEAQ